MQFLKTVERGKANYPKHFVSHSNIRKSFYSGDALPYVTITLLYENDQT